MTTLLTAMIVSCKDGKHEDITTSGVSADALASQSATDLKSEEAQQENAKEENRNDLSYKSGSGDTVTETVNVADATVTNAAKTGHESAEKPAQVVVQAPVKKLIKTGTLRMEVEDYSKTRKNINTLIPKFNAYIGGENENNDGSKIEASITIRVPFNQFDGLMEAMAGEGHYIANKTVTVDDVTAEYVDLAARLKTKLDVEDQYRGILKKAQKIPDILEVENELRVIREEIEAAQGRMKFINDQTQYSTLNLSVYQNLPYEAVPQPGFFGRFAEAFVNGWHGLLGFIVGLTSVWPFLIILTIAAILGRKFLRRSLKQV